MRALRRAGALVLATAACALALGVATAAAADECNGLMVCLPLEGPWVVIPPASAGSAAMADWVLACPRRGYIVAGTDVRIGDRAIDVAIRGETGSPVAPGTTTREAVRFSGLYAGATRRAVSFRPFIGCIPTSGGGARNQTARGANHAGFKPTRPVSFVVVGRRLAATRTQIVARCPAGTRLVDWGHAVSFHTALAPTAAVLGQITTVARATGATVTVSARARSSALSSAPEVQIQAACSRAGR